MDDESTGKHGEPAEGPPPPPSTLPPAPPPPPSPLPPPPPPASPASDAGSPASQGGSPAPTVAWVMPADLRRPTIDIGSVVGRSFDTFGREWSLFLVLAAPAGLGAFLQSLLVGPTGASTAGTLFSLYDLVPIFGASLVSAAFALVSSVAITGAADSLWQGRAIGEAGAFRIGLRALPRYLGVVLVIGFIVAGIALVIGLAVIAAAAAAGPAAIVLVVMLAVVLVPAGIYVSARLALLAPVIVLERQGVLGSIVRAWELSRGHALVLFLLTIVVALTTALPLWGGSLFAGSVDNPVIGGVALGIATLIFEPLPAIAVVLAWGDRVGDRHRDSELMARGRGRGIAALLVFGLGGILLVAGLGVASQVMSTAP